ncbi:Mus7/MMS22 family-domain-containing protein [Xylaria palmicola]|nr:Mus7/MMS22 family-domain-containing protein [Xylaria palmicola]
MAKWKELGEVPDSDDESAWDSQESQSLPIPPPLASARAHAATDNNESQAIWGIPPSSQGSAGEHRALASPKPQEPEPSPSTPAPGLPLYEQRHGSTSPLSSVPDLDHGLESNVSTTDALSPGQTAREGTAPPSHADVPKHPVRRTLEIPLPVARGTQQARKEDARLGRSLRPRKPIQEHPYLLESVHYSKTLKSHGLRPVRMLAEEEGNRRKDEDSQEQDFEEDSQANSKDLTQGETEESQATAQSDVQPEADDVLLSDIGEPSPTPDISASPFGSPRRAIQSSQEDDDEFPDPKDVEKWKPNEITRQVRKRPSSAKASIERKRRRIGDSVQIAKTPPVLPDISNVYDIPASPPPTSPGILSITPMAVVNRLEGKSAATLTPKPSSNISSRMHSPAPAHHHSKVIDLTSLEDGSESESDPSVASSHSTSDNERDHVRLGARRIRGVLPASWLRLDQQTSTHKPKPTSRHRSPNLSPERSTRKGVALRRPMSPRPRRSSTLFISDDSDDSDSTVRLPEPDISFDDLASPAFEDDAVSVIEEDHIDNMVSREGRASPGFKLQRKRKRSQQSMFNGQPGQAKRQQRITGLLGRNNSVSIQPKRLQVSSGATGAGRSGKKNSGKTKTTTARPPRLGILDVVEPNAPAFIRIAARTASRRRDRGRSSPTNKTIMLGTRQDSIDAVGVLKRWNEGLILPRDLVSARPQPHWDEVDKPAALAHIVQMPRPLKAQANRVVTSSRYSQPHRPVKQASIDGFVDAGVRGQDNLTPRSEDIMIGKLTRRDTLFRPAQLETSGDTVSRFTFDARKKALDAIYRRSGKLLSTSRTSNLEQTISRQGPTHNRQLEPKALKPAENNPTSKLPGNQRKPKCKKQVQPRSLDTSAPQYTHANDPLPVELNPPTTALDVSNREANGKLLGLAPYGAHYTQHFEIFPLDHGVFFHESTILGSGRLKRALEGKSLGSLGEHRGRCAFTFDEQTLHWGPWDSQTSSELGIIFDWMVDQLDASPVDSELETPSPVRAANFILTYVQDYLSFFGPESLNTFACRVIDVLQVFERRLKEKPKVLTHLVQPFVEVLTRILVIAMQVLRLCQSNKLSEAFQMEEILKRLAATTTEVLLRTDLVEVRDMYDRLQQMAFREKGIRSGEYSMICWVTLIRILEEAGLPRTGFWAVIATRMFGPNMDDTVDATVLERAWRTLFVLLPLGEFDSTGIVIPGIRRTAPLEGWTIPQRLLRRVFHLYQTNSRQSAGFNDYLRASTSRCHYLIEQWGWYKCSAVLGTIFDFFASQDLHNLRNEEVYQSPPFLDELSGSPSLATSPGDRCFHIYLKLIAMSIKQLTKVGLTKEVKNLVARLLPNHSRQHDKMMAATEAEMAALRNHHDLLCTLFWSAPQEMRPSIQSIESLVVLSSSHKEACLINIRAWSRLARFVLSSSEDAPVYKPLADWQRNIAQQVLEQFLSVEREVSEQLSTMSADVCKKITEYHKDAVISRNKSVAIDLLHFSMKAFQEVMRHSQTLSAASFVLNHYPLEKILTRLSFSSPKADWDILLVVIDILNYYLTRIDESTSAEPVQVGEDAIMLLERRFTSPLLSVVRGAFSIKAGSMGVNRIDHYDLCMEQGVVLAGRLATCLIHARLARLRQVFQVGKYSLFQDLSKPANSATRKYVALFLATVVEKGFADFKDLGLTPLDIFLSEITKPSEYLAYENRLATSFKRLNEAYLNSAVIEISNTPSYESNRDLFNYVLVSMRRALLQADPTQKLALQQLFSKALSFTMDRMKADLKSMVLNSPEHLSHVEFVRSIISLIRSRDICPVDNFFYQISQEYSPSRQDPRLQTAGILSWGLKFEEGDSKAASGLFYLLYANFQFALAKGELENETNILNESMRHSHVFNFVLSTILPAIIRTVAQAPEGWVLLHAYIEAIDARLSSACIHRQIGEDMMMDILALHTMVLASTYSLRTRATVEFQNEDIVFLTLMVKALNLLSPSVTAYLINDADAPIAGDFTKIRDELTDFTRAADTCLSGLARNCNEKGTDPEPSRLFEGLTSHGPETAPRGNDQINRFSSHMVQDIRNNWVSNEAFITLKEPSRQQKPSATQSTQGTRLPGWSRSELWQGLWEQISAWNHDHDMTRRLEALGTFYDEFLF